MEPTRLAQQCGWKDGDTGGDLPGKEKELEVCPHKSYHRAKGPAIACCRSISHRGHPSRLPFGSLHSALTGPDRDGLQIFPPTVNGRRSLHGLNSVASPGLADFALDTDRLSHGRTCPWVRGLWTSAIPRSATGLRFFPHARVVGWPAPRLRPAPSTSPRRSGDAPANPFRSPCPQ
jgi:hypothetical protein